MHWALVHGLWVPVILIFLQLGPESEVCNVGGPECKLTVFWVVHHLGCNGGLQNMNSLSSSCPALWNAMEEAQRVNSLSSRQPNNPGYNGGAQSMNSLPSNQANCPGWMVSGNLIKISCEKRTKWRIGCYRNRIVKIESNLRINILQFLILQKLLSFFQIRMNLSSFPALQ